MHLLAEIGNGDLLVDMFYIFLFIIWFWLLITIFGDIFRSDDLGGVAKTLWIIFVILLPYLGIFVYLIARGKGMAERNVAAMQAAQQAQAEYIKSVAGAGSTSAVRGDRASRRPQGEGRHLRGGVRHGEGQGPRLDSPTPARPDPRDHTVAGVPSFRDLRWAHVPGERGGRRRRAAAAGSVLGGGARHRAAHRRVRRLRDAARRRGWTGARPVLPTRRRAVVRSADGSTSTCAEATARRRWSSGCSFWARATSTSVRATSRGWCWRTPRATPSASWRSDRRTSEPVPSRRCRSTRPTRTATRSSGPG